MKILGLLVVNVFYVCVHVVSLTELLLADLALKSLESSVYSVNVGFEVYSSSKVLSTLLALVVGCVTHTQFTINPIK